MLNTRLHPRMWQAFFDDLSTAFQQDHEPRYVMLRVSTPDQAGTRDVAPWLAFERISYDPVAGTLRILLDGFDYHINAPATIWAAVEADGNVERLVALSRDGSRDYIEFSRYHIPHEGASGRSRLEGPTPVRNDPAGSWKLSGEAGRRLAG